MKIGIGIDTGGTYTDAVAYDFSEHKMLGKAKSPTTKDDLTVGIVGALDGLDGLDGSLLQKAELVSLSTTLATNACVEDRGGHVGLVMIGVKELDVELAGEDHGLPPAGDILIVPAEVTINGDILEQPDWEAFTQAAGDWIEGKQAVAIVQYAARNCGAVLEKQAKKIIVEQYARPVVCGHELFTDLNMMRRAASALLNARLLPVIEEFLLSVKEALRIRHVQAPVVIVRSDGTLMSEEFAAYRPVETLLCGPAASAMFGAQIADGKDALVVDMGGTTSDIAMIRNGIPIRAKHGVDIGPWKTFVKGMYVHTLGLGGDSAVRYDRQLRLSVGPQRVIPFSMLAQRYPSVKEEIRDIMQDRKYKNLCLHEFFVLVKEPPEGMGLSEKEQQLCAALRQSPLSFVQVSQLLRTDYYTLNADRLERLGIVVRSGLTPTDIMHIRGEFTAYDTEAAHLAVQCVSQAMGAADGALCDTIYEMMEKRLYLELVNCMLVQNDVIDDNSGEQLERVQAEAWAKRSGKPSFIRPVFHTAAALVGVGAPTHVFLQGVADALHTNGLIPENADVANALGALMGKVSCEYEIGIGCSRSEGGIPTYIVHGAEGNIAFEELEDATKEARKQATEIAAAEARERGARGRIGVEVGENHHNAYDANGMEIYLDSVVTARATGGIVGE